MTGRLSAQLEAAGLIRRAEAQGGFGAIIKRGDPDRGALILLIAVLLLTNSLSRLNEYATWAPF